MDLRVGKLELAAGRCIAVFRGGGLSRAEQMVKGRPDLYEVAGSPSGPAELTKLSCRWRPIPSEKGTVLTVLVGACTDDANRVYQRVLRSLDESLEGGLEQANPVKLSQMSYRTIGECCRDEARYHDSLVSIRFFLRVLEILAAVAVFRHGVRPLVFRPEDYATAMASHSDHRKFDDVLRMVVDCSEEECQRILTLLEELHQRGEIVYGVQRSSMSMMTCFVSSLDEGGHIHFIDGGDGGYAQAARQLKEQLRERANHASA